MDDSKPGLDNTLRLPGALNRVTSATNEIYLRNNEFKFISFNYIFTKHWNASQISYNNEYCVVN